MEHMKKDLAYIYARLSMLGENEDSINRQVEMCKEECERRGWRYQVFVEPKGHRSGRYERSRPEWKRMNQSLNNPELVAVVFSDLSRPSRNLVTLRMFVDGLQAKGILFVSLRENIDTRTAAGKMILNNIAAANEWFAADISERYSRHIHKIIRDGGTWGTPPLGLKPVGKGKFRKYVLDDVGYWIINGCYVMGRKNECPAANPEAHVWHAYIETVEKFLYLFLERGMGANRAADELNRLGYRWKRRTDGTPRFIIPQNLNNLKGSKLAAQKPVIAGYRGIIPDELIDRCLAKVEANRHKVNNGRRPYVTQLCWQLIYCKHCGQRYKIHITSGKNRPKSFYYYLHQPVPCANKRFVRVEEIDEQVIRRIEQAFQVPEEVIGEILEQLKRVPPPNDNREQRTRVQKAIERLEEMRALGDITRDRFLELKEKYEQELNGLPAPSPASRRIETAADVRRLRNTGQLLREGKTVDPVTANITLSGIAQRILIAEGNAVDIVPHEWCAPFFARGALARSPNL